MNFKITEELTIALLLSSVTVTELNLVFAAIKTISTEKKTWDVFSACLRDEVCTIGNQMSEIVCTITQKCEIFSNKNTYTSFFYSNLTNQKNKLELLSTTAEQSKKSSDSIRMTGNGPNPVKNSTSTRAAITRPKVVADRPPQLNLFMIDS